MLDKIIGGLILVDTFIYCVICFLIDVFLLSNRIKLKDWMITTLVALGSILPRNNLLTMVLFFMLSIICFYIRAGYTFVASIVAMTSIIYYQRRIINEFRDNWKD